MEEARAEWWVQWISSLNPFHLILHGLSLILLLYLGLMRPFSRRSRQHPEQLTEQEIDEIISDWKPVELPCALSRSQQRNSRELVISKATSTHATVNGVENVLHVAKCNYLGLLGNPRIETAAEKTMRNYGVGSCGPRGFYGSIDVHLELEKRIAKFMGTEDAIMYSSSFATISSAIPAFSKRGDILICDDGVSHATQTGVLLSRSRVYYFKHNDMEDLRRVLELTQHKKKQRLVRKFVVVESLYYNHGDIAPLPQILEMKPKYCFRLIMDETHSIGVLGKTGRGLCEHFGIDGSKVDILTGSFSTAFGAGGGFCVGTKTVVYHQRLNGSGYVFSASLPPYLATCAHTAIDIVSEDSSLVAILAEKTKKVHEALAKVSKLVVVSAKISPVIHLRLSKSGDSEADEDILEEIVTRVLLSDKVLISRAKYIDSEKFRPPPSLRICVNASLSDSDIELIASSLQRAVNTIIKS